ncbi:Gluconokinase [Candidatus Hydrogenisulfobacillus filiaventi]|uniref:Gluconokinase n=1 Tax=Candidatus Hydrogenisulfobacillus filiaventi TaxID=2707344 RepID=A0A6F8ZD34_9FIRM|nr:Gluconokinase [Candidatus Hydrogenisulfobacillus filiaventi]
MGVNQAAADSLRWLRATIAPGSRYPELDQEAAAVPPGAEGLFFLPYLSGERAPGGLPHARGVFWGLSTAHSRAHRYWKGWPATCARQPN